MDTVNWTRGEKLRFLGLGVELFGKAGNADDHAHERAALDAEPRCTWCGEPVKRCLQGKPGTCGFAIEP